jgi:hypothetical protein
MKGILSGQRPDLTPAQIAGGVPVLANLLHVFGVFSLSAAQADSLEKTINYGLGLVVADAAVRIGRNIKDARVESSALAMTGEPTGATPGLEPEHEDLMDTDGLVSDEEEFAAAPVVHDDGIDVHDSDDPVRPEAGQVPVDPDRSP